MYTLQVYNRISRTLQPTGYSVVYTTVCILEHVNIQPWIYSWTYRALYTNTTCKIKKRKTRHAHGTLAWDALFSSCWLLCLVDPRQRQGTIVIEEQQQQHEEVSDGDKRDQPGVVPGQVRGEGRVHGEHSESRQPEPWRGAIATTCNGGGGGRRRRSTTSSPGVLGFLGHGWWEDQSDALEAWRGKGSSNSPGTSSFLSLGPCLVHKTFWF